MVCGAFKFIMTTLVKKLTKKLIDAPDPFKCNALLRTGHWLDQPKVDSNTVPKIWQVPGCATRHYKSKDIQNCLKNKRLLFVGDSTIRQVFASTATALDPKFNYSSGNKHSDLTLDHGEVKLEFIWDPWLNSSRLTSELGFFVKREEGMTPPAVLLTGAGLWHSKHVDKNPGGHWKAAIDNVLQHMKWSKSTVQRAHSDLLLFAPVTIPVWDRITEVNKKTILPEEVASMNEYLKKMTLTQNANVLWAYEEINKDIPQTFDESGIHDVPSIASLKADILLNLRCNSEREEYPFDGTCCNVYKAPNYIQWLALIGTLLAIFASLILNGCRKLQY